MTRVSLSRLLTLSLAIALCLGTMGTFAVAEDEIVLEWFVDDTNSANAYPDRDTLVEKVIYEKTGVRVNMTFATSGTHDQLNAMIATDTLPDIVTFGIYTNQPNLLMNQMIDAGMLYSFQDLDAMVPGLLDVCRSDVLSWWSSADGKTYGYPNSAYSDEDTPNNPRASQPTSPLSMRRDLWEALGSPDISTPDAFLEACLRAQNEIGQYNGYDIIGLQCYPGVLNSIDIIRQYFSVPFENEDGTYSYVWDQPLFKEVLGFFNKAYRMGVLWESNFSDSNDTVAEHVTQGRTFALITNPSSYGNTGMIPLYRSDNNATHFLPVLGNSLGEDPLLETPQNWGTMPTSVTTSSKNPEACAKLFKFLISNEGQILLFAGVEGETYYRNEDGKIVTTYDSTKARELGLNTMFPLRNYNYYMTQYPFDPNTYTAGYINKSDMIPYGYAKKATAKNDPNDDRQTEMAELSTQINEYATSMYGKIIIASTEEEFSSLYDEMVKTINAMGLDTLREYDNDNFQRAKKSLGVEHLWPRY